MSLEAIYIHTEQNQLIKLKSGEQAAFDYFYKTYSLMVYRKLLKLVKVDLMAEEILQQIFVKLWEKRHLIDTSQPLKGYLLQIAQNMVIDFYRRLAREQRLQTELKYHFTEVSDITEADIIYKETNQLLHQAIAQLPDQQKTVFRLSKLEGKSYSEISELLGISTSTINGHVVRATKNVKAYMFNAQQVSAPLLLSVVIRMIIKNI